MNAWLIFVEDLSINVKENQKIGDMDQYYYILLHRYETMALFLRNVNGTTCVIILILACFFTGCTSNQNTPKNQVATQIPQSEANSVIIEKFAFNPATLMIKPGTTVSWTNRDGVDHTIVSDSVSAVQFKSGQLANGASYSFSFTQPGTYTYYCSIHPSMKGKIVVQL